MIEDIYQQRLASATAHHALLQRAWSITGNVRLIVALVAMGCAWQWFQFRTASWLFAVLVGLVAFAWLAIRQRRLRVLRDATAAMMKVNQRALDRLNLNWQELPDPPTVAVERSHPYAWDLNIIGRASLIQRIGTPATHHGWQALYTDLLSDRECDDVVDRQGAIRELANELELRQAMESVGGLAEDIPDPQPMLDWAQDTPWLKHRMWLSLWGVIGPLLVVSTIIFWAFGRVPGVAVLGPLVLNGLVMALAGTPAAQRVQRVAALRDAMTSYHMVISLVRMRSPQSQLLRTMSDRLSQADLAALSRVANLIMPTGSLLYFPLQISLMWDVNVLRVLERWQSEHGRHLSGWLDAVGEWESLSAFAVLAHDHPDWSTPTIDPGAKGFTAEALAHPLIDHFLAVPNDVEIGPVGTFLFVTGSNMSGKSTLLRAIGCNAVLAQVGAPVAARSLTMPPLLVSSCMRVEDSLAHGVSFFMAELQRLKAVLDRVEAADRRMGLYLLDEILQGTNTVERQIASRMVLTQLAEQQAIGAVSSHDLGLIEGSALEQFAQLVHFSEQFEGDTMTFDYRLRPGLATSSNALKLMAQLGFDVSHQTE